MGKPLKVLKTTQETYLEEELDKVIEVSDGGDLISRFTEEILH